VQRIRHLFISVTRLPTIPKLWLSPLHAVLKPDKTTGARFTLGLPKIRKWVFWRKWAKVTFKILII
jgi:hypothetical protein